MGGAQDFAAQGCCCTACCAIPSSRREINSRGSRSLNPIPEAGMLLTMPQGRSCWWCGVGAGWRQRRRAAGTSSMITVGLKQGCCPVWWTCSQHACCWLFDRRSLSADAQVAAHACQDRQSLLEGARRSACERKASFTPPVTVAGRALIPQVIFDR